MTSLVEHGKGHTVDRMHGIGIPNPKKGRSNPKTTFVEKLLLVITIIILPLETHLFRDVASVAVTLGTGGLALAGSGLL